MTSPNVGAFVDTGGAVLIVGALVVLTVVVSVWFWLENRRPLDDTDEWCSRVDDEIRSCGRGPGRARATVTETGVIVSFPARLRVVVDSVERTGDEAEATVFDWPSTGGVA